MSSSRKQYPDEIRVSELLEPYPYRRTGTRTEVEDELARKNYIDEMFRRSIYGKYLAHPGKIKRGEGEGAVLAQQAEEPTRAQRPTQSNSRIGRCLDAFVGGAKIGMAMGVTMSLTYAVVMRIPMRQVMGSMLQSMVMFGTLIGIGGMLRGCKG